MTDVRILTAILVMGAAAVVVKALELYRWYIHEEPLEGPVVIDTATNGGVTQR